MTEPAATPQPQTAPRGYGVGETAHRFENATL
jgi:hypothetical protein